VAPVLLVPDPAQATRLYVVDQAGLLRVIDHGQLLNKPLLDVTALLVKLGANYDERGFLGLALHPGFAQAGHAGEGRFYTYTSEPVQGPADFTVPMPAGALMNHQSVVREWRWDGTSETIDPTSSRVVLRIDEPQSNHNAGHMEFGPTVTVPHPGDGGGATTPQRPRHAGTVRTSTRFGKIIRIR
jgi:hypothetical protein